MARISKVALFWGGGESRERDTYKGFKKPNGGLPLERRRSFNRAMMPEKVGAAHEVPATPKKGDI